MARRCRRNDIAGIMTQRNRQWGTMNNFIRFLVLACLGIACAKSAWAQVPALRDVPDGIPAAVRGALLAEHNLLATHREEIRAKTASHNQRCSSVDEGSTAAASCAQAQAELQKIIAAYGADVEQFNQELDRAEQNARNNPFVAADSQSPQQHVRMGAAANVRGTVYWLTGDGRRVPIVAGGALYTGARIVTGVDGHLQILLLDETVFTIGANSDMVLDEFVYDPSTNIDKVTARLAKGIFRWVTGKVARKSPDQLRVKLPVATIGIRGTDFEVKYEPGVPGSIRLFSGELEIGESRTGKSFMMHAGQAATISMDGSISLD
ncbi:MAG TPA: FecR domain-containing protein [Acidobacteriota bacterium]|nr:FecR domain-containing protein [Acidobacteriota bacterium]